MAVYTKEKMIEEMVKCTASAEYFLTNYGWVYHPKKGHVKFNLFAYQKESLKSFQENRFNIILKSRQTGYSTLTAGYIAWMIIFHKAKEIVVVANKQDNAQGFIRKVKTFIKKTPDWMVPNFDSDNKKRIELTNGSWVAAQATTGDAGRSESLSLLVIDEAAMIDTGKVDDLWAAAFPTLSLGGSAIIISTPKGVGNFYHKQWLSAMNKDSDFVPLVAHWTEHPLYGKGATWECTNCGHVQNHGNVNPLKPVIVCDNCAENSLKPTSAWYKEQAKQLGDPRKVAQEMDMDFLGSGDNVIMEEYIRQAEKNCRVPILVTGPQNNLWVWEEPIVGEEYLITADVARGDGSDYSACHVIKKRNKEQVAEYRGKIPPDMYAKFLIELGEQYNEGLIVCEANSIGYATCLKLVELEYPNIFYSMKGFHGRDRRKLEKAFKNTDAMIPGFQTTMTTRPLMMAQLEQDIRTMEFIIRSTRTIAELRTLIWVNGKPMAMSGYNDDLCTSAAIGLYIMSTALNDIQATRESIIASLNAINNSNEDANENMPVLNKAFSKGFRTKNPWSMTVGNGVQEDLKWLIGRK